MTVNQPVHNGTHLTNNMQVTGVYIAGYAVARPPLYDGYVFTVTDCPLSMKSQLADGRARKQMV